MLSKKTISRLRKIEKFILKEPKRFNMREGLVLSENAVDQLEQPPCGTACCIAGAAYIIGNDFKNLNNISREWTQVGSYATGYLDFRDYRTRDRLLHANEWPEFYKTSYIHSKTAAERAFIGAARIEHFIATNGVE